MWVNPPPQSKQDVIKIARNLNLSNEEFETASFCGLFFLDKYLYKRSRLEVYPLNRYFLARPITLLETYWKIEVMIRMNGSTLKMAFLYWEEFYVNPIPSCMVVENSKQQRYIISHPIGKIISCFCIFIVLMHRNVLYRILLHFTYCIGSYWIILFCILLYCIFIYCIILYWIIL